MILKSIGIYHFLFKCKDYVEEFYQTYLEAENTKQLGAAANELRDKAPLPMNSMLQKEDGKVAVEQRQARQKMKVVNVLPTTPCKLHLLSMYQ